MKRLSAALDQLEAVGSRAAQAGGERRDLADTLAVMQDDRGRLAGELDAALTRTQTLEQATAEVSQRLGQAGATLRRLLDEAFVAAAASTDTSSTEAVSAEAMGD